MLKLIVDSASDLSAENIEKLQIQVLPTPIIIDDKMYLDGKDITLSQLTNIMGTSGHTLKTHHVTAAMYEQAFLPHAASGDSVVLLCFTTGMASNLDAAKIGAVSVKEKYPGFKITILDSKSASGGYGMIAEKLAAMISQGKEEAEVLEAADYYINHMQHLFTVSIMNYFMKGGRISHALGAACDTLDVRPIFTLNEDGAVSLVKPMQGDHHAMNAIVDMMVNSGIDFSKQTLALSYCDDKDDKEYFMKLLNEKVHPKAIKVYSIGCTTAAHAGYSLIGICYLNEVDEKYL